MSNVERMKIEDMLAAIRLVTEAQRVLENSAAQWNRALEALTADDSEEQAQIDSGFAKISNGIAELHTRMLDEWRTLKDSL